MMNWTASDTTAAAIQLLTFFFLFRAGVANLFLSTANFFQVEFTSVTQSKWWCSGP